MATNVPTVGHGRVNPSVYFNPMAQQISKSPATHSKVHAIVSVTSTFVTYDLEREHQRQHGNTPRLEMVHDHLFRVTSAYH